MSKCQNLEVEISEFGITNEFQTQYYEVEVCVPTIEETDEFDYVFNFVFTDNP